MLRRRRPGSRPGLELAARALGPARARSACPVGWSLATRRRPALEGRRRRTLLDRRSGLRARPRRRGRPGPAAGWRLPRYREMQPPVRVDVLRPAWASLARARIARARSSAATPKTRAASQVNPGPAIVRRPWRGRARAGTPATQRALRLNRRRRHRLHGSCAPGPVDERAKRARSAVSAQSSRTQRHTAPAIPRKSRPVAAVRQPSFTFLRQLAGRAALSCTTFDRLSRPIRKWPRSMKDGRAAFASAAPIFQAERGRGRQLGHARSALRFAPFARAAAPRPSALEAAEEQLLHLAHRARPP